MTLTLTQVFEAIFIAIMLILLTNPHLLPILHAGQPASAFFHLF